MTMEFIEIEAFVTIAEAGSFTKAAMTLHVSQPAVSRRIELLENELGAPLFERNRGGTRLTSAGEAFLPFAHRVLASVRDGSAAVDASQTGEEGAIALALVGTLASTSLTDRLRSFRESHPGVRLSLRTARSDEVGRLVQTGEVSLGLRYFPDPSPVIQSEIIDTEKLVVVCAGNSRFVSRTSPQSHELSGVPWVGFASTAGTSGEQFARTLHRQLVRAGLDESELIIVDSLTAQKRLIEADFGLGLLPISSIDEELHVGSLRVIEIPYVAASIPVVMIHRRDGFLGPAAHRLQAIQRSNTPSKRNASA
jgi:DNA-binding transcriptional LysR family regulator